MTAADSDSVGDLRNVKCPSDWEVLTLWHAKPGGTATW